MNKCEIALFVAFYFYLLNMAVTMHMYRESFSFQAQILMLKLGFLKLNDSLITKKKINVCFS